MVGTQGSHEKTAGDAGCEEGYHPNPRPVRTEPPDEGNCVQGWNVLQRCGYRNKNVQAHLFVFGILYSTGCKPCPLLTAHPSHLALTEEWTLIPLPITSFVSNGRDGMSVGERDSWGVISLVGARVVVVLLNPPQSNDLIGGVMLSATSSIQSSFPLHPWQTPHTLEENWPSCSLSWFWPPPWSNLGLLGWVPHEKPALSSRI